MPISILTSEEAIRNRRTLPYVGWPNRDDLENNRVEPRAMPHFAADFELDPGETIFTVGSCFARNVELSLINLGFRIPPRELLHTPEFEGVGADILANYTVPSIFQSFDWALNPDSDFNPELQFFEVAPDQYRDLDFIPLQNSSTKEQCLARRKAMIECYREVLNCRTIFMTLGLSEVWYDNATKSYLNVTPRTDALERFPGRFEMHVLSYAETYDYLKKTMDLLQAHCPSNLRMLITVSPVALTLTHRDMDVMVANTYSKSTLRVAAEELAAEYDFITYVPTYEAIMHTDRELAWDDDLIHVKPDTIDFNIRRIVKQLTSTQTSSDGMPQQVEMSFEAALERLVSIRNSDGPAAALDFGKTQKHLLADTTQFTIAYMRLALLLKDHAAAKEAYNCLPRRFCEKHLIELEYLTGTDDFTAAAAWIDAHDMSGRQTERVMRLWLNAEIGFTKAGAMDLGRIRGVVTKWSQDNTRDPRPFYLYARFLKDQGRYADAVTFFDAAYDRLQFLESYQQIPETHDLMLSHAEALAVLGKAADARAVLAKVRPANDMEKLRFDMAERLLDADTGAD